MIEVTLHISEDCPFNIQMKAHPVLMVYKELPLNTRLATKKDFFTATGELIKEKAYFWQYVMGKDFKASRIKSAAHWDEDLKQAIQGKRVWVLDK